MVNKYNSLKKKKKKKKKRKKNGETNIVVQFVESNKMSNP